MTLSSAKLSPPEIRRVAPRTRLDPALAQASPGTALWIQGPPGEGKSTLVADYLHRTDEQFIWFRFESSDEDPATFFASLDAAIGWAGRQGLVYSTEWRNDADEFARRWAIDRAPLIAARTIVFDNLSAGLSAECLDWLAVIVAEWILVVRIFITAHLFPEGRWLVLLARSELVVLASDELRFREDEIEAMLALRGIVDNGLSKWIGHCTGGWAAGVVIASVLPRSTVGQFGEVELGQRLLLEHFSHEVLVKLDQPDQQIVARTALLQFVTPELAIRLSGCRDAQARLASLAERRLFVDRVGVPRPTYRYHSVLREALLRRLTDPADRHRLARDTVSALLDEGSGVEALELASDELGDEARVACVEAAANDCLNGGRQEFWVGHAKRISPAVLAQHHSVLVRLALTASTFDEDTTQGWLRAAAQACKKRNDPAGSALIAAAALAAYLLGLQSMSDITQWRDRFRTSFAIADGSLAGRDQFLLRAAALIALTFDEEDPAVFGVSDWLGEFVRTMWSLGEDKDAQLYFVCGMATLSYQRMRSPDGAEIEAFLQKFRTAPAYCRAPPPLMFAWLYEEADYYYHSGRYQSHRAQIERMRRCAEQLPLSAVHVCCDYQEGLNALAQGEVEAASRFATRAIEIASQFPCRMLAFALKLHGRCLLHGGHWDDARKASERALAVARATAMEASWATMFAMEAYCAALGVGDWARAKNLAGQQVALLSGANRRIWTLHCMAADALRDIDEGADATASLSALFGEARATGWTTLLAPLPAISGALAWAAIDAGVEVAFVNSMIRQRNLPPPRGAGATWPWAVRVGLLGERSIQLDGRTLTWRGKAPKKPLELLRVLAVSPRLSVDIPTLVELLWPDEDGGRKSLESTISRLREILQDPMCIKLTEGLVSLSRESVFVDYQWARRQFLEIISRVNEAHDSQYAMSAIDRILRVPAALAVLDEDPAPIRAAADEHEQNRTAALAALGHACRLRGDAEKACAVFEAAILGSPAVERLYTELMRCQIALGRPNDALETFRRCRRMLSILLGRGPSRETEGLRATLE